MGTCDPGLRHERELTVRDQDTALAMGSGDVPVLATPRLLALAEAACVGAVAGELPEGQTSVGAFAQIDHERPTAVGDTVSAEATLVGHHGRRLEFNVIVRQGDEIVAKIRHRRVLLDRARFLAKVAAGAQAP